MTRTLRDALLLLGGLILSVLVLWRGAQMVLSPQRWIERAYGRFLRREAGPPRGQATILVEWMWRLIGCVFIFAGGVFSLVIVSVLLGTHNSEGRTEPSRIYLPGRQYWLQMLLILVGGAIGTIALTKPEIVIRTQLRLLGADYNAREDRLRGWKFIVRLAGAAMICCLSYATYVWLIR